MNYVIVCGAGNFGGPEYALALAIGLALDVALWVHHQGAAIRGAARPILPLK
jgi:hypothetical protein